MSRFFESPNFDPWRSPERGFQQRWTTWPGPKVVGSSDAITVAAKAAQARMPFVDSVARRVDEAVKRATRPRRLYL